MKHFVVICCVSALLAAINSVSFLSCEAWDAGGSNSQQIFGHAPGSPFAVAGDPGNVVVGDMNKDESLI